MPTRGASVTRNDGSFAWSLASDALAPHSETFWKLGDLIFFFSLPQKIAVLLEIDESFTFRGIGENNWLEKVLFRIIDRKQIRGGNSSSSPLPEK